MDAIAKDALVGEDLEGNQAVASLLVTPRREQGNDETGDAGTERRDEWAHRCTPT